MSSKIRVLPDDVINKIAAGEVIENPASVVKELVDNSLDAGANEISVEISSGGRQLIRVSDNGSGMGEDDALLCLERHGTSKIRDIDDLFELSTMGFRGEALPSIASISKFTLLTCPKAQGGVQQVKEGSMVIVEGGKILKVCPAIRDPGTTIEVKTLFYNVPVRRKFQKSPTYDAAEVLKTLSLLALAYPDIKFQLISDNKGVLSTQPSKDVSFQKNFSERVLAVLGADFFEESLPILLEKEHYRLEGFIGKPSNHRANRTGQYLFINQRPVWSPIISHAVKEGFGTMLPAQRFPVFALHLKMPGDMVDINVHPQKKEVRLRYEQEIKHWITEAVFQALRSISHDCSAISFPHLNFSQEISFEKVVVDKTELPIQKPFLLPKPIEREPEANETPWLKPYELSKALIPPIKDQKEEPSLPISDLNLFKVVMTVPGYLIVDQSALCIVDQQRAHQRILFENFLRSRTSGKKEASAQTLLVPFSIELGLAEAEILRRHLTSLSDLGFGIQDFGYGSFLVEMLPSHLENVDVRSLMLALIEELSQSEVSDLLKKEQQMAKLASRLAISSKTHLSVHQAQLLVDKLMSCQTFLFCPQGKSILVRLSAEEITKCLFKT